MSPPLLSLSSLSSLLSSIFESQAFLNTTDKFIYNALVQQDKSDTFLIERAQLMLAQYSSEGLYSQDVCLAFLGHKFRVVLDLPDG